jgi:alpha,alpha-trehalase
VLTRSTVEVEKWDSLLPLPKPYVVPGGRFREVYYWDSYFTMLGLAESGHWDNVEDMVTNFAAEIDAWGHIPNGNRSYYLSRSQPPFFSFMVELLATHDGDRVLKTWLPQMEKEYQYWMQGADALEPGKANQRVVRMEDGALLNRYWDDNDTPRPESWLDDVTTAKNNPNRPATEIYRDLRLPPPRAGISAHAGWMTRKTGHHPHHQHRAGRSQRADVPHGENPRARQQGRGRQRQSGAVRCPGQRPPEGAGEISVE